MAEKEGFEPSKPFRGLHDFQSCALDQLGDFSRSWSGKNRYSFLRQQYYYNRAFRNVKGQISLSGEKCPGRRLRRITCPAVWHTKTRRRRGDGGTVPGERRAARPSPGRFPAAAGRSGVSDFRFLDGKGPFVCRRPPENVSLFAMFVKMPIDGTAKTDYDENKFICFRRAGNRTPRGRKTLGKRRAAHVYSGNHREQ